MTAHERLVRVVEKVLREQIGSIVIDEDAEAVVAALEAGPLAGLLAERDRLRVQVEAVRELASEWCDPDSPTVMSGPQRIFGWFLQDALNENGAPNSGGEDADCAVAGGRTA